VCVPNSNIDMHNRSITVEPNNESLASSSTLFLFGDNKQEAKYTPLRSGL